MEPQQDRDDDDQFYVISDAEHQILETMKQNLSDLSNLTQYEQSVKQKYSEIHVETTESKWSHFEDLNALKSSVTVKFEEIRNALTLREHEILSIIQKHKDSVHRKMESVTEEMECKMNENMKLIADHEVYLNAAICRFKNVLKYGADCSEDTDCKAMTASQRRTEIIEIAKAVNEQNIKMMERYNVNKKALKRFLNRKSIDSIFGDKLSVRFSAEIDGVIPDIARIVRFNDTISVQMEDAILVNDNTLKLSVRIEPKQKIRRYDVVYCSGRSSKEMEWMKPHKISITKNDNILVHFKGDDPPNDADDDDRKCGDEMNGFLFIKIRVQNVENVWSSFSRICKLQIERRFGGQNGRRCRQLLWCLASDSKGNQLDIRCNDLSIMQPANRWKCKVHGVNKGMPKNAAIYLAKNCGSILPKTVRREMDRMHRVKSNGSGSVVAAATTQRTFDVLFQIGGHRSCECGAFILDHDQFRNDRNAENEVDLFRWNVPNLKVMNEGCSVMLDNDRLFVIGGIEKHYGFSDKIYCLSLGPFGGAQSEWEWQSVSRMQTKRCWSSSIAMKDSLVVIGGRNHWRSQSVVERYDYAQDQWQYLKQCHFPRFKAGICLMANRRASLLAADMERKRKWSNLM